jgi:Regulator of ribonuclease activity B
MQNTFFDQKSYENDIDLGINEDVLKRIYKDNVKPTDMLPVEFFFVTDKKAKATAFKKQLKEQFPAYESLEISDYDGNFEISGITDPIEMSLAVINNWNKVMWDLGYQFDCKIDGWQVES